MGDSSTQSVGVGAQNGTARTLHPDANNKQFALAVQYPDVALHRALQPAYSHDNTKNTRGLNGDMQRFFAKLIKSRF